MSIVYLNEDGAVLSVKEGVARIIKKEEILRSVPIEKLEAVVLFGNTGISSASMLRLLEKGIPVTWLSPTGKYFGRLESTQNVNIERQRHQFRAGDNEYFKIKFAGNIIEAKIHNQKVILRRYNRRKEIKEVSDLCEQMNFYEKKVLTAVSLNQIMGYEGTASKLYFKALGMLVNPEFYFESRTKQPPRDYFNSLLSFGYTLLLYSIQASIVNRGLNPYMGIMHQIKRGHPALVSDIMEEWRAVIVDSLVMNCVQNKLIAPEDFQPVDKNGGVYLKRETSKAFIRKFEEKMRQECTYIADSDDISNENKKSYREIIDYKISTLVNAIEWQNPEMYKPIKIR